MIQYVMKFVEYIVKKVDVYRYKLCLLNMNKNISTPFSQAVAKMGVLL